jgi:hypothetical protein
LSGDQILAAVLHRVKSKAFATAGDQYSGTLIFGTLELSDWGWRLFQIE